MNSSRIESAQRLADMLIERLDATPPIDIVKLVEEHASIHPFPSNIPDLDAVLLGLDSDDKHVFVNTERPPRRRRFTLAHELGHIMLSWHQAHELICEADSENDGDDPDLSHRLPGSDPTSEEIRMQELEADAFAARTLVPKRFIDSIAGLSVSEMLEKLQTADVSIPAGMRALSDSLPPGFVFVMLDDSDLVERTWRSGPPSSGVPTVLGISRGLPIDKPLALRTMADHGWAYHYGRRVWWGRAEIDIPVPEGDAEWRPLLRSLCDSVTDTPAAAHRIWSSVCAIGGALQGEVGDVALERMAGLLTIRLRRRVELDDFVKSPQLEDFVFARARDLHRSARKNRSQKLTR
ncbi:MULTISPECIES: ImmA/IrrE family metallo-endopeptidase [unclassified Arthrobacter]|uniref:ImmA/IrrE family metallo-endopeptidase n=1 Tax=unclassified Arthrobacter TaxID=235627 RepID=UPI00288348F0|nr:MULTISPECIES: ImmA/IrrE family metallo-endopeptidase [unclassified Arthrobacter]